MKLLYTGKKDYCDPLGRFIAKTGDVIEFDDREAEFLLKSSRCFERLEVNEDEDRR